MISGDLRSVLQAGPPAEPPEHLDWLKSLRRAWADGATNEEAREVITRYVQDLLGESAARVIERVEALDLLERMKAWPVWGGAPYDADNPQCLYNLIGVYVQAISDSLRPPVAPYMRSYLHVSPDSPLILSDDYLYENVWHILDWEPFFEQSHARYDGPFARWRKKDAFATLYPDTYSPALFGPRADAYPRDWTNLSREPQRFIQLMSVDYFQAHRDELILYTNDYFRDHNNLDTFSDSTYHEQFSRDLARFIEQAQLYTVFFDAEATCHHVEGCWGHRHHLDDPGVYIDCWE